MPKRRPKSKQHNIPCPNKDCSLYGKIGEGNIVSNGTYQTKSKSERVRYFICRSCGRTFTERINTIFYDLRANKNKFLYTLAILTQGVSLRETARESHLKLDTIKRWLNLAASRSEQINEILMKDYPIIRMEELEALWSFVRRNALKERAASLKKKKDILEIKQDLDYLFY